MQKALIIRDKKAPNSKFDENFGLDELNQLLSEGWKVVNSTALGSGNAHYHECLVVIEKD